MKTHSAKIMDSYSIIAQKFSPILSFRLKYLYYLKEIRWQEDVQYLEKGRL